MINPFVSALSYISTSLSLITGGSDDGIPRENGILILTQLNFGEALSQHELLMVKFYLPSCPHCQAFAPEYVKVGELLSAQKSKIQLGQVDAAVEKPLVAEHQIKGFPALKLFKNGTQLHYYGPKKAEHIVQWLNKNSSR